MKKLLFVLILFAGCASPAQDYVEADNATWDTPAGRGIDSHVDAWVDQTAWDTDATKDAGVKDALHELLKAARARRSHALAQFHPVTK